MKKDAYTMHWENNSVIRVSNLYIGDQGISSVTFGSIDPREM